MKQFLSRHSSRIIAALSGFDRIVFRGTLRQLAHVGGLLSFLCYKRVLLKDFGSYAEALTEQVRTASEQVAEAAGRPVVYLPSTQEDKEKRVLAILKRQPIDSGLICVLSCVEPCRSFEIHRNRDSQRLELRNTLRKCLHLYHYFLHPDFGLMHVRLQTWLPFTVNICLNGREWLAHQMTAAGIGYEQRDNCFVSIDDFPRAQHLLDQQLRTNWPQTLDRLRVSAHPAHGALFANDVMPYYWSVHQMEWATDVLFESPAALAAIYPDLIRYAITQFSSADVMRFLGRKLTGLFKGEIVSDYGCRVEGLRVKHRVNSNSVKAYDKFQRILRVESTINRPRDLKVYRRKEGDPKGPLAWRQLRKGVSGIHRIAEVSQAANERYLDALSQLENRTRVRDLVDRVCHPTTLRGQSVRALRPWSAPDIHLLQAVSRGEFVLTGFRNCDLRSILFPKSSACPPERKRASGRVTRLLRLLRAHGLIRKLPKTHRYQLTVNGRATINAVLAARNAEIGALLKAAA